MNRIISSKVTKAIYDDNFETLQSLVKLGKRINIQDNLGWTPLHAAVSKKRLDMVEFLCKRPNAPLNVQCFEGQTCLLLACQQKCDQQIIRVLVEAGADVTIPNNEDITPLHAASICGHDSCNVAEILIQHGANVDAQDFNKYTPLHCAVENDCPELVDLLINSGADTSLTEYNGLNPLMLTFQDHFCCTERLLQFTTDVNTVAMDGWSALMLAINSGKIDIAFELVKRGANVNVTVQNLTPVHLAVMRQEVDLFKCLWSKINLRTMENSHSLPHLMLIHRWYVPERVDCFFCVLDTPNLQNIIAIHQNFLAFLFRMEMDNKLEVVICDIVRKVLRGVASVNKIELVCFIQNFYMCKHKFQLIDILIEEGKADFDKKSLILFAAEFDPELVPTLLTLSINVNPLNVFRYFSRISRNDILILKLVLYILSLCTPSFSLATKYLSHLKTFNINNLDTVSYTLKGITVLEALQIHRYVEYAISEQEKNAMFIVYNKIYENLTRNMVPSLKELSRDVIRRDLLQNYQSMRKCDIVLQRLHLPKDITDIIKLKVPVNNL